MKRALMLLGIAALACGGSATDDGAAGGAAGSGAAGSGATAGSAGAAGNGVGGSAGAAGAGGGTLCDDLKNDYQSLVPKALTCPLDASGQACNVWVDQNVNGCGYFTWGDASNVEVLAELKKLRDEFAQSCPPAICPTGGFPPTLPAKCVDTGQGGTTGTCVPQTQ